MSTASQQAWGVENHTAIKILQSRRAADSLANRLRAVRRARNWTQQYLADMADTTQGVIQKVENGKSLRPRKILKIAQALEVEPSWLMFGAGDATKLSPEAIAVARAWSALPEVERKKLKEKINLLSRA